MTTFAGPFNSGGGANFNEQQWRQMLGELFGDGTLLGFNLAVTAGSGMQVVVSAGRAVGDGMYFSSDATTNLAIATSDPTNPRIDLVVVHFNMTGSTDAQGVTTRNAALLVSKGTPAPSPSAPSLLQTYDTVWEVPLAQVAVGAGVSSISSGNITDVHFWSAPQNAKYSFFSGTVVGTGPTTFNHLLGITPNYFILSASGATPAAFACTNQNATTVDVRSSVSGASFFGIAAHP